ncbi:Protein red1 [Diplodia seriata]|uniref:Protein red1 n=1 Tax=Diplodia seriata TaxID=420778 RepID=A0A1S8B952_9PEZI|nr:Protein red1 [Diplodia seriata]
MAAKNSKASTKSTAAATSSATPSPAPTSAALAQAPPEPPSTPSPKEQENSKQENTSVADPAVLAAQKKEAQNELLRRKIEALKIPKKKAEEEARAKAQAVAASLSASRTPSSSGGASTTAMPKSEIPVRPAQQEVATTSSTPRKDAQSSPSLPLPSPGGIPGLFMTSTVPQVAPQPAQDSSGVSANRGRKRPVAADFDDLQQPRAPTAFKRPFGQSQNDHEQVIIEVSDDETAGSVMDIDEADELQPSAQPSAQPPKGGANRNLPSLTNFPSRPNLSRQGSAHSTPPASQPPIPAARVADLKRKEEELAALKKLIAEKERQRLAKAQSSRAQTPATPTYPPSQIPQPVSSPALNTTINKELSRVQPDVRSESAGRGDTPSAALRSTPQSPAEHGWKLRRRAEIQSGISAFDADLNSNMSRLEQLRREMEQIEAENKRRQQEKESLINELEGLGIDTEGMPHEELQAKKDEIMHQQQEANAAAAEGNPSQLASEMHPKVAATADKAASESSGERMPMSDGEIDNESDTTEAEMDMSDSDAETEGPARIQTASNTETTQISGALAEPAPAEEAQPPATYPAETSEQEDTEDFYSSEPRPEDSTSGPGPIIAQADHTSAGSNQQYLQADANGTAEDVGDYVPPGNIGQQPESGSTSSASSESSEAEPEAQRQERETGQLTDAALESENEAHLEHLEPATDVLMSGSTNQNVTDGLQTGDASSEGMDEDEDEYDPADMLPHPSPSAAASDYPTPQTSSTEAVATQPAPQSVSGSQASRDVGSGSTSSAPRTPLISIIADEVAPELQGREPGPEADLKKHSFYTPYESPLKQFKAYRYHPQYSQEVPGGYRSLTYSHEIDPMKPLCSFEAAGGICNDSACDGQHFRTMGISEDKVLVQLGIVNPGRTPEEQDKWRVDLKQVLKGLREQNVRHAESVAAAITKYRREFLQDPSRVLNI